MSYKYKRGNYRHPTKQEISRAMGLTVAGVIIGVLTLMSVWLAHYLNKQIEIALTIEF